MATFIEHVAGLAPEGVILRSPNQERSIASDLLATVFKDRRRILLSMSVVFGLSVMIGVAAPSRYVATAQLLVLPSGIYAPQQDAAGGAPSPSLLDRDTYLKNEIEILTGPSLAEATILAVGLSRLYPASQAKWFLARQPSSTDPVVRAAGRFAHDFTATADKTGNIISVSFQSRDPALAAKVVNKAVELYLVKRALLFQDSQLGLIAAQVPGLKAALDAAEAALAAFETSQNISNYTIQRDILLHQQADIVRDLQQADSLADQAGQRLVALRSQLGEASADVVMYSDTNLQMQIDNLKTSLENLKIREAGLEVTASDESPSLREVRAQIAANKIALDRLRDASSASEVRKGRNPLVSKLELDRVDAQQDVQVASARRDADNRQLVQVGLALQKLVSAEPELVRLQRTRDLAADRFQAINKILNDRRVFESIALQRSSNIRIIQPAETPLEATKLKMLIIIGGVLLSLFAGIVTAVLSEIFRRGYITSGKLERSLRVPVLTSVGDLPALRHPTAFFIQEAAE